MYERHHLLSIDYFNSDGIPLQVLRREPQPPYPIHSHEFSELVIITDGQGEHVTENGVFSVEKGDVFVINGDLSHGYSRLDDLCLINIIFDLRKLAIPFLDLGRSTGFHTLFTVDPVFRRGERSVGMMRIEGSEYRALLTLVADLEQSLGTAFPGSQFAGLTSFMSVLSFLSRFYDRQEQTLDRAYPHRLGAAFSYLDSHLDKTVTVAELVSLTGMSESTLLRGFKRISGFGPVTYHVRRRIDRASWLLANTGMSISAVALETGFDDPNYFSRQFKNVKKLTPKAWRRQSMSGT